MLETDHCYTSAASRTTVKPLINVKRCCRICLTYQPDVIFSDFLVITRESQLGFYQLTREKLPINQTLPYYICLKCHKSIQAINSYRQALSFTQRNLESYISSKGHRKNFRRHIETIQNFQAIQATIAPPPEKPKRKSKIIKSEQPQDFSVQIPRVQVKREINEIKPEELPFDHEEEVEVPKPEKRKRSEQKLTRKKSKINLPRFNCEKCHMTSVTQHHLSLHESGPVKCAECEKMCKDIVQYRSHVAKHRAAEKMATCEICGLLTQVVKMKCHKDTHLPRQLSCDICGKAFLKGHHLRVHQKQVHFNSREHRCQYCGQGYNLPHDLKVHQVRKHLDELPEDERPKLQCDCCQRMFLTKGALKCHLTFMNMPKPEKSNEPKVQQKKKSQAHGFQCDFCNAQFETKFEFKDHRSMYHEIKCSICNKPFVSQMLHDIHKKKHQSETYIRGYKCNEAGCTARFRKPYLLQIHKRSHSGERPFSCDDCDSAFRTHSDLRKHRLAVHKDKNIQIIHKTGTGTYSCQACNLRFQLYSQLTLHNRKVHDKTLYYECGRCDKSFGSSFALRYHMRRCGNQLIEEIGDSEVVELEEEVEEQKYETKIEMIEEYEYGVEYLEEEICSS